MVKEHGKVVIERKSDYERYMESEILLYNITQAIVDCRNPDFEDEYNGERDAYFGISEYLRENPREIINYFDDFCEVFNVEHQIKKYELKDIEELKEKIRNIEFFRRDNAFVEEDIEPVLELDSSDGLYEYFEGKVPEYVLDDIYENRENLDESDYVKFERNKMILEW